MKYLWDLPNENEIREKEIVKRPCIFPVFGRCCRNQHQIGYSRRQLSRRETELAL